MAWMGILFWAYKLVGIATCPHIAPSDVGLSAFLRRVKVGKLLRNVPR